MHTLSGRILSLMACVALAGCGEETGNEMPELDPEEPTSRQVTFVNQCEQTIWLAALTNTQSGGWEMPARTKCTGNSDCPQGFNCDTGSGLCQLVMDFPTDTSGTLSGRFWPRTDCSFQPDGSCAVFRDGVAHNCCATGGCTTDGKNFGLQCDTSGVAPTTVAEFTLQTRGNNDFYDISLIDGFNVPVEMRVDTRPDCPGGFGDCDYWCGNPGGADPVTPGLADFGCDWTLGQDCAADPKLVVVEPGFVKSAADCKTPAQFRETPIGNVCTCGMTSKGDPLDSDCTGAGEVCGFGSNEIIGTRICGQPAGCTTGKALCGVGAYFTGSGGDPCKVGSDCATGQCVSGKCSASPADFLACGDLVTTPISCQSSDDCPALIGFECQSDADCPPPTECVSLGAPPRRGETKVPMVCREPCQSGSCAGAQCSSDADCLMFNQAATGTFSRCDQTSGQCVGTHASLLQASGVNGQSCYIHYYASQTDPSAACGGCPTDCDDPPCLPWPEPPPADTCLNNNPDWEGFVEPQLVSFKKACPTAYSFPFDDPTSTFQCSNGTDNTVSYTVTFCPPQPAV